MNNVHMYHCVQCGYSTNIKCNYKKHMFRKTKCTPNVNRHTPNVNKDTPNVNTNTPNVNTNTLNVNMDTQTVNAHCIQCMQCKTIILKRNFNRHENSCKGYPVDCCKYCGKQCTSRQSKYQHQRICMNKTVAPPVERMDERNVNPVGNVTNITNNITNNHSTIHITKTDISNYLMFTGFGREQISYLTENIHADSRIDAIRKTFTDTMDLVHFNADHPENQTIRKVNKKSELLEFRMPDNTWEFEPEKTGLKKIQMNLEHKFQTKFDDIDDYNRTALSEMLYQKTMRGGIAERDILNKYDVRNPNGRLFIEQRCADQVRKERLVYFKENDLTEKSAMIGTRWMQQTLRQMENITRQRYRLPLKPEIEYTPGQGLTSNSHVLSG